MNRLTKMGITLAGTGGALMFMATPLAFAGTPTTSTSTPVTNTSLSAAGSLQVQDGSNASGSVLDQNSSLSAGGVSASSYYNDNNNAGYTQTTTTYNNGNGANNTVSTDSYTNNGGSDWTNATNYNSQGSSASLNQSQTIGNAFNANGGTQVGVAGAISGDVGTKTNTSSLPSSDDSSPYSYWENSGTTTTTTTKNDITGGAGLLVQGQSGAGASGSTLTQGANVQGGLVSADNYKYSTNSNGSTETVNQYDNGLLTNSTTTDVNKGSKSYTDATGFSNPFASVSYDQSQDIQYAGQGGTQLTGAAVVAGNDFWKNVTTTSTPGDSHNQGGNGDGGYHH